MSRVHLSLINIEHTKDSVRYRVETTDFNDAELSEEIGIVKIDSINRTYEFTPTNTWSSYCFIPPWVYGLGGSEQQQLIETRFKGYEAGGWTASIHRRITEMIQKDHFL